MSEQAHDGEEATPVAPDDGGRRRLSSVLVAVALVLGVAGAGLLTGVIGEGQPASGPLRVAEEMPATGMHQTAGPSSNSPMLVADPLDSRFVALANRMDAPDFNCALQVSGDGGRSFAPSNPVRKLPAGADKCYAPEVAFDDAGVLHYLFVGLRGEGNEPMGAFLVTSRDRAKTFSEPRRVLGPLNFGVRMAIDPTMGESGRIHLVWLHAGADPALGGFADVENPILSAYSDNGGRTFTEPVQVNRASRRRVVAPSLALGPDHAVHVAYFDLQEDQRDYQGLEGPTWEGTWSVVATRSLDGGRTFEPDVVVDDDVRPPERVMLIFTMPPPSVVAHGRIACAAWTDARNGDADAVVSCSGDRGGRWGRPKRLNDDRVGNGLRQYLPRLSMAPGGRIDAVFLDRRREPRNIGNDVFYTYSLDGGRTFAPNRRLTQELSDSTIGQQYGVVSAEGQVEFGARLGLLSGRRFALTAWPDTRNSEPGTGQDLFVARVDGLPDRQRSLWRPSTGAALIFVGLAVAALSFVVRRRPRPVPAP